MMQAFTVFSQDTGAILRTVHCPADEKALQCGAGEDWLPGDYPADRWRMVDGVPEPHQVAKPAPDWRALRARAYPPLAELADALYWQAQGNPAPMADWLARCSAVKQAYPKGVS